MFLVKMDVLYFKLLGVAGLAMLWGSVIGWGGTKIKLNSFITIFFPTRVLASREQNFCLLQFLLP